MGNTTERLAGAREHVAPDWTKERESAVRARLERAVARRKHRQVALAGASALLVLLGALVLWSRSMAPDHAPSASAIRVTPPSPLLHFEDGSAVTAMSAEARAEPVEVGPELVSTRLTLGTARFSVTPNPQRAFRVIARDVTVTVLGTVFTVGLEPGSVRVQVERGRVRVAWPAGERELGVGEQVVVANAAEPALAVAAEPATPRNEAEAPVAAEPAAPRNEAEAPAVAASEHTPRSGGGAAPSPSWRVLAQDGEYVRAFARMSSEGPAAVRDEPGDLLLSADVARLGGHAARRLHPRPHAPRPARTPAGSRAGVLDSAPSRAARRARSGRPGPRGGELVARRRSVARARAGDGVCRAVSQWAEDRGSAEARRAGVRAGRSDRAGPNPATSSRRARAAKARRRRPRTPMSLGLRGGWSHDSFNR